MLLFEAMAETFGVRDCNCVALRKAARRISNFYDGQLAESGLRATQFAILALVGGVGTVSVNDIAAKLALDRTTAGKNLRPLEEAGLVSVARSKNDGRERAISLTKEGHAKLKMAVPLWRQAQARFEAANGADHAAKLRTDLGNLKFE